MSQLKKQLSQLLPELKCESKALRCPEARKRLRDLLFIVNSKRTVIQACQSRCVSRDYFEKWAKRLIKAGSLSALESKSRAPKRVWNKTHGITTNRIEALREVRPFLGAERIKQQLGLKQSERTVHNILRRLGLVSKKYRRKMNKRHTKRYRRSLPGHLQMDFKYVPFKIKGQQCYQLSCVDHHSSWRMIRCYSTKCTKSVAAFLDELIINCPFPIVQIQTDNDRAFTNKFVLNKTANCTEHVVNVWRFKHGIEHRLIPVGEKELNGKVENTHKQDDREFFAWINPQDLSEMQSLTLDYEDYWNDERQTKALGWKTPAETIEASYVRVLASALNLKSKKKKKRKKVSAVDRYLKWLDEDAKKYSS